MYQTHPHQHALIALCHAAQLPIIPEPHQLRIPLFAPKQYLDIRLDCAPDHHLAWTLHAIRLGTLRKLDAGLVPCGEPWHQALLITWAGYREQGGRQLFVDWSTAPATPWQTG